MSDELKKDQTGEPEEKKSSESAETEVKKEETPPEPEVKQEEKKETPAEDESGDKPAKKNKKGKKKDRDKEKPLEKPREKEARQAEQQKEKAPEPSEDEGMGSGSLGFIVVAALLMIMVYFIWFSKPGGTPDPGKATPAATQTAEVQEDAKLKTAMQNVKESRGPKTQMKLLDRINYFKEMKEKKSNARIELVDWTVKPAQGKAEPLRYYDVTFQWNENGTAVIFAWQIDLESNNVVAVNKSAKDLETYDDQLWKELSEAPSPTPAPSPTVVAIASPTPEPTDMASPGPTLTPVATPDPDATPAQSPTPKPTDGSIEILPPVTPTPSPTKTTAPPDLPKIDFGDEFYQLTGVMTLSGKKTAMLKYENKTYSGTVGTKLPDGWTIQSITGSSVTLRKGSQVRAVMLKESFSAPKAPTTYDNKSYPKAGSKTPSPAPTTDETGTPEKTPSGEPTIIPID